VLCVYRESGEREGEVWLTVVAERFEHAGRIFW
jgi:hypothetical protein